MKERKNLLILLCLVVLIFAVALRFNAEEMRLSGNGLYWDVELVLHDIEEGRRFFSSSQSLGKSEADISFKIKSGDSIENIRSYEFELLNVNIVGEAKTNKMDAVINRRFFAEDKLIHWIDEFGFVNGRMTWVEDGQKKEEMIRLTVE